jgi:NADH-quinone oxidoreductase subunit J
MITSIFFYLFAAILLASAAAVVSVRNPVHAVLFLILCFFNAAGLFLLMGAEFLAFLILIVYVGAVAVLFLFVVMMLDIKAKEAASSPLAKKPSRFVGVLVTLVLLAQLVLVGAAWVSDPQAVGALVPDAGDNVHALGRVLYTDFFYPFQVAGLVLLVAMVGAIVLTLRDRRGTKRQKPDRQLAVEVSDVIDVRKVPSGQGVKI